MPFRKILVPVDFSPSSTQGLHQAVELARALGGTLDVIHVRDGRPTASGGAGASAEAEFQTLLDTVRKSLGDKLAYRSLEGDPAAQILEEAKRTQADLIVMGTHGRIGRLHMLVGSVAQSVVRNAHCPVLTVRLSDGSDEALKDRLRGGARIDERAG